MELELFTEAEKIMGEILNLEDTLQNIEGQISRVNNDEERHFSVDFSLRQLISFQVLVSEDKNLCINLLTTLQEGITEGLRKKELEFKLL